MGLQQRPYRTLARRRHADKLTSDVDPDGSQDSYFLESDAQMDDRQWGCWGREEGGQAHLGTGWPDASRERRETEYEAPWSDDATRGTLQEAPIYTRPAGLIPPYPSIL
eukprot:GHVU01142271.1.p2 GENE.GHVU01142271.1~~GHVU01142271.1.p2  ORF type:complete len:109 (+),score=15.38 GHVU01142271.1:188-514(+)